MPFSAILLVFEKKLHVFVLQVCKFTDLQVHIYTDCPFFYGMSVKISDLLHLLLAKEWALSAGKLPPIGLPRE